MQDRHTIPTTTRVMGTMIMWSTRPAACAASCAALTALAGEIGAWRRPGTGAPLQGRAQQQHSRALAGALAGPAPCVMHTPGACAWAMRCPPPQATHSRWPAERRWRRWHAACIVADAAATRARGANSKYTSAICIYGTDYM
jgi:hypothetical protein